MIGRTGVLISQKEYFDSDIFEIKFKATSWMVPEASVVVYYIHFTGEIIYDYVSVPFDGELPNKVDKINKFLYNVLNRYF